MDAWMQSLAYGDWKRCAPRSASYAGCLAWARLALQWAERYRVHGMRRMAAHALSEARFWRKLAVGDLRAFTGRMP